MGYKSARCPNCSGELSLDPAMERGHCVYCGSNIVVEEAIRNVKIDGVASAGNLIIMADNAREIGNYKDAYDYYKKALEIDPGNSQTMLNRALMAGMLAKFDNTMIDDFINSISIAINKAPDDEKNSLKIKASSGITAVATHLFSTIDISHREFGPWAGYYKKSTDSFENPENYYNIENVNTYYKRDFVMKIIKALDMASEYDPQNREANLRIISGITQLAPWEETQTDSKLIDLLVEKDDELKQIDPTHVTRKEGWDEDLEKSNKGCRSQIILVTVGLVIVFVSYIIFCYVLEFLNI